MEEIRVVGMKKLLNPFTRVDVQLAKLVKKVPQGRIGSMADTTAIGSSPS